MTQFPSNVDLRALLESNDGESIRQACLHVHPGSIADQLQDLDPEQVWGVLRRLDQADAVAVFSHLDTGLQAELANDRNIDEVASLAELMDADDRTDLVQRLDKERSDRLLSKLSSRAREETQRLSRYDQDSVGAEMNINFAVLNPTMTAGDALNALREQASEKETINESLVVDERGSLVGKVSLKRIVTASLQTPISEIMRTDLTTLEASEPRTEAARLIQSQDLFLLPIVEGGRPVGIVTVDDVMDVIEEEVSDTMYQKAGIGDITHQKDHVWSQRLTSGSIWYPVRVRIMYLMVVLVGGFLVGGVIGAYEDLLEAVIFTAIFVPLIMDMGGNVGTQSTTIFARGLALGHIDLKKFMPYFIREGTIGVAMGIVLGILGGTVALLWQGIPNGVPQLGIAVGVALFSVVTIAAMLGFLLPFVLTKLGFDHAPGADPFITTIKDFTGLLIYFGLVAALLPIDLDEEADEDLAAVVEPAPEMADDRLELIVDQRAELRSQGPIGSR